jgi:hypothetical protein
VRRFRVNEPDVVFETFDEEIVAVNLETGNYYSLSTSGPAIWIGISEGCGLDEIIEKLRTSFADGQDEIARAVASFAERLVAEQLLVELAADGPAPSRAAAPASASASASEMPPFQAPVIENYSDMQDLLMLDPIHDVDPAGWPLAKTNP